MGHEELIETYLNMKIKSNHGLFFLLFFKRYTAGYLKQAWVAITDEGLVEIACLLSYKAKS